MKKKKKKTDDDRAMLLQITPRAHRPTTIDESKNIKMTVEQQMTRVRYASREKEAEQRAIRCARLDGCQCQII